MPRGPGAQAVDRALAILMRVAMEGEEGARLADLAARTGLERSTAHRLLASLVRSGFVHQDRVTRRYFPGLEFFTVAAAASNRSDMAMAVRHALAELTRQTGASSMFLMRSSDELICVDLHFGDLDTAACPTDLGTRWPIGAGAPGIAVLSVLPAGEAEDLAVGNARRFAVEPESAVRLIRRRLQDVRALGCAIDLDPASGMATFAVAVLGRAGRPEGALALNGPALALDPDPQGAVVAALRRQAHDMQLAIGAPPRIVPHREISLGL